MKMNNAVAGFHMLMILSYVDGNFDSEEGKIIVKYMHEFFPLPINYDRQIEIISNLKKDSYFTHFCTAMNDFYEDSTEKERAHFLDFAIKLAKADNNISKEENIYLNELFNSWDLNQVQ
jgi:hypothetical protein